jgi:hypothetical protein
MTFAIGKEEFEASLPYVCEGCVIALSYDLMPLVLLITNPTPRCRTQ